MKLNYTSIPIDPAIRIEQQQIKKKGLVGRMRFRKGMICYELDLTTGRIQPADVTHYADIKGNPKHKLDIKEACIYDVAINLQNAKRKFINRLYKLKTGA